MAEAVVSFVLEKLSPLLIEEAKFIYGVDGQVQEIYDELRWMKAFLRDADAKAKQNEEQLIREWVADVRTLAYDAGDVLESFLLRVESRRGGGIINILKRYVCIFIECIVLHKVGSEIKAIKARITELKSRRETYGIRSLSEVQGSSNFSSERQNQLRRTYSHVIEDDFVGLERDVEKLVAHLVNDDKDGNEYYSVVSICGMGGLGKTTLARKVYNYAEVKRHFDAFAWVCISQKWQPTDILQQILIKLLPEENDRIVKSSNDELIRKLFYIQQEKRCLIILDDIWSTEAWDFLKNAFPRESTKSKLLLTSRNMKVALYVDPKGFLHQPRILNEDESWMLLKKKAFCKRDQTDPEEVKEQEKLGIEMVRRCGGLPLAIVVLGGILVTKHSLGEWENVSQNIKSFLRHGEVMGQRHGGVAEILALSYNDLPYQLKPCFVYLGKFQEDSEIKVEGLYQLWMAESMVLSNDRKEGETMMDVAECYLGELAKRCVVQVQLRKERYGITKFSSCRLHDMLRDLCLSKAKEEDFFHTIDFKHGNNSEHVGSSTSFTNKARRVVVYSQEENTSSIDVSVNKITSQHLRSLLFFNESRKYEVRMPRMVESCLNDSKLLRVLAIEGLDPFELPKATSSLIHLRYLSLRRTSFVMFPSSIKNLKHLQTLDLRGRKSVSFQCKGNVLGKMRQLRHLYLPYKILHSFKVSKLRLDGLINLEILENFDPSWCKSEDLIKLTNLRKLTATVKSKNLKGAEDIISYLTTNFGRIRHSSLRFVYCNFASEEWQTILIQLLWSACVHELDARGSLGNKLPGYNNISTFPSRLTKLDLFFSKLVEDPMPILEALPNLHSLRLYRAFKGEEMVCSSNGFLQLRSLRLWELNNLQSWRVEDGAMPKLSYLEIGGYRAGGLSLRMIPDGLRFITTLQELNVYGMNEEFSKRVQAVVDGEKGEDFDKIGHVASISVRG